MREIKQDLLNLRIMKRKILSGIAVLAVVAVAVWNLSLGLKAKGMLPDNILANIEALANIEIPGTHGACVYYNNEECHLVIVTPTGNYTAIYENAKYP